MNENNLVVESALREQIAKEIEDLISPPPIDDIEYLVVDVITRCANIARGDNRNEQSKS